VKRVGLIDNLGDIPSLLNSEFYLTSANELMKVTGGNTGNIAFVTGTRKIIANQISRIDWDLNPHEVQDNFDHIVICCANQLGSHVDLGYWADQLDKFQLPVTLIGLGAQSDNQFDIPELPDGTKRFLDVVNSLKCNGGNNIAVRGDFSASLLRKLGFESASIGCPSLFCSNVVDLGSQILKRSNKVNFERVAVAAGNPWHDPSSLLERILVDIVDRYRGDYIIQHPFEMLQFALGEIKGIEEISIDRFLDVYGNRFSFSSLVSWFKRNSSFYIDMGSWMHQLRKFDGILGPRFHGVAIGVQTGIPGLLITIDSRTEELAISSGIKHIPLKDALNMNLENLVYLIKWSKKCATNFDRNRQQRAISLIDFLKSNDLDPSAHLISLSKS
jgi:hypothetical protein